MSKRQIYLAMLFSSFFGALIALGGYMIFYPQSEDFKSFEDQQNVRFSSYAADTANYVVPEGLNFVYAAEIATPGVVHIRSKYSSTPASSSGTPFDQYFKEFFGERGQRMPSRSSGSGVIISDNGYIVTNNHVVDDATEVEVLLNDNRTFEATVVGTDPTTDLALLKIDGKNLPVVKFGHSEGVKVGEWVLAIGNPFEFRSTVTAGIVSAKARNINILRDPNNMQIESFIQTDAAVNPGNSGGALVNLRGELIGINTAIATQTGMYSGYSFAVPVTLVKKVMNDLKEFGVVQRALLGISILDVSAELAKARGLSVLRGVYVERVTAGSAAEEAGLQSGDVIVAIEGKSVDNVAKLQEFVAVRHPGEKIEVTYIRDNKEKKTRATLKGTMGTTEVVQAKNSFSIEGGTFENLSTEDKRNLKLEGGAKAIDVEDGKWQEAGVRPGFVVTSIDKSTIRNIQDLARVMSNKKGGILIEGVYPDGTEAFYGIGW